ncbi:MAG: DUF1080 domain-containing protein [Verrucomicrobia bacterium]|nr:DUF1080 domain-containing protein [Verrucomicrobiota bacterium]
MSRHARRILQERSDRKVVTIGDHIADTFSPRGSIKWMSVTWTGTICKTDELLIKILREQQDTATKLRALWTLHATRFFEFPDAEPASSLIRELLKSTDQLIRAWTIQIICESGSTVMTEGQKQMSRSLRDYKAPEKARYINEVSELNRLAREDKSPVVRLYLASAAQRVEPTNRWDLVAALNSHAEDASDHNLPLMAWYAMEPLVSVDMQRALVLAIESKLPNILNFTARRVAAIGKPAALAAITAILNLASTDKQRLDILSGLSVALKGQRSVTMPAGWGNVESKLSASANSEIRALTQSLSLTFGSTSALAALRKTATDASAEVGARRTALDSLLAAKDPGLPPILQSLLKETGLRSAALRGLGLYDDAQSPAAILSVYGGLSAGEKRDALNTLTARPTYARQLLVAISNGSVSAKDLSADLVRQLRNLKNADLDQQIQKVWGAYRESTEDKKQEIEKYRRIYRAGGSTPGDAIRGRAVFAKTCQQCHTLFDVGGKVGPDITGSNRGDLQYLLENILDPNAVIPNEYRASNLETKDGRSITGIVKKQDDKSVTIASATESVIVPRNEIASLAQSELSMMPEGLLASLADQEVRDLIYYLGRPGQAPLMATPDTLGLFFNGKDLSGWDGAEELWKVENGEIVGRTATGLDHNEFLKSQMVLGDFRLVVKMKLTPNKENSGIQFRSEKHGETEMKGYQADAGAGWWGKLYEENGRAILWDKPGEQYVNRDDWNTYEILAVGSKVRTAINSHLCVDFDDPNGARQGIIGLQMHAGGPLEVRFKELQVELNPKGEMTTVK